jgi:hypothetical protein
MKNIIQILGGLLLTALFLMFALARIAFEIIGASTAPDDFALLQERMPAMTDWLFSTPWWVPTILLFGMCTGGAWLIWSGTRRTASEEIQIQSESMPQGNGLTEDQVQSLINAHLSAWKSDALPKAFASHADIHSHDEKLAALADQIKSLRPLVDGGQKQIADLERKWSDWTKAHTDSNRDRFKNVDGGFRAIHDRERLKELFASIEDQAAWLLRSSKGEKVDNWGEWNARHFEWQGLLIDYGQIAKHYLSDVPGEIGNVPSHRISGDWPEDDSLFPSNDAMIAHRTAAVMLRNLREQHGRTISCVESFAFNSPSMKGIRDD